MTGHAATGRERGAVIPITALTLAVLIVFAAFAIDLGYERVVRRDLQAKADVIALDLVRRLDGSSVSTLENPSTAAGANFAAAKAESRERNDFAPAADLTLTVTLGTVDTNGDFVVLSGSQVPDAVRVTARDDDVEKFFSAGVAATERSAVASTSPTVDFQLGSYLASVGNDQNALLQRIYAAAFCPDPPQAACSASLTALSYQGLANASITLGQLAAAMGLASPNELFTGSVGASDVFRATADVLTANGNPGGAATLNGIAAQVGAGATFEMGDVVEVDTSDPANAANAAVDVLGLLSASAFLIDGNNTVTVPGTDLGVPGLTSMTIALDVIESVRYRYDHRVRPADPRGPLVNRQVGATVTSNITISPAGLPVLSGTSTVVVSVAGALAQPTAAFCPGNASAQGQSVILQVTPQPVSVTTSQSLASALNTVRVNVPSLTAQAQSSTQADQFDYTSEFLPPVGTGTTRRMGSSSLNLQNALRATGGNTTVVGILVPLDTAVNSINAVLNPLNAALDNLIVSRLTQALGLNLGGGDVGALDMECSAPALVG